jgi:formylglycine-generating enzyme required for sulfatase activity
VTVNVPNAQVYVDGEMKGTASPTSALNVRDLPVGDVQIRVESAGCSPVQQGASIEPGRWTQAKLVLHKQSVSPEGSEFVLIPAGSFQMERGAQGPDQYISSPRPVHEVTIGRPFWMGKTPVTVRQFRAFVDATGYRTEAEKGDGSNVWTDRWEQKADANWRNPHFDQEDGCPVVCVSWNDAQAYTQWLNGKNPGLTYRLPTEAEWDYACRAGTTGERYGDLDAIAWYESNSGGRTHPVGQKQPNAFGLYDMLGNVFQWCRDWEGESYHSSRPATDPQGELNGSCRVVRGGPWYL